MVSKDELISFETEIGDLFNAAKIKAPVHLYHGNEDQIIRVFQKVDVNNDWVLCTWRNHYQALLKGVPRDLLKQKILNGKSMVLNMPEHKFVCSSIVGGVPSIAAGIAFASKMKGNNERVWCFLGDMSAETGAFHEAYKYSVNHDLPITFVVENNDKSVLTPTQDIWGRKEPYYLGENVQDSNWFESKHLIHYRYNNSKYPHAGAGKRVQF